MCENLNPDRIRCESCRTINLAKHINYPKPDMQIYDKCSPTQKVECARVTELPLHPTCIKVCTKEEYNLKKSGKKLTLPKMPPYAHGKLMYAVKAGILVGAVYFTYTQGVWGDQQDVTECIRRWQEYIRSINTRRPPTFDQCGNVIVFNLKSAISFFLIRRCRLEVELYEDEVARGSLVFIKRKMLKPPVPFTPKLYSLNFQKKESTESLMAPVYAIYKNFVTTCFSGVVKVPLIVKCAYVDYIKALERRQAELDKERKIKKRSG